MRKLAATHPHAVVHDAGRPQFAHPRVDERDAGAAAPPGAQFGGVGFRPGEAVELGTEVARREPRLVEEGVAEEVAPAELPQERLGLRTACRADAVPHLLAATPRPSAAAG